MSVGGCFTDNADLYATGPEPTQTGTSTTGESTETTDVSDTSDPSTTEVETTATTETTESTTTESTTETPDCPPDQQNLWFPDVDMDGHGDPDKGELLCGQPEGYVTIGDDCDDNEKFAYPGNRELCDGIDNDCNTIVDEWSEFNEFCNDCTLASAGNSFYNFCETASTWEQARVACQDRGGDLLILESEAEETQLSGYTEASPTGWWIGLSDVANEGTFVWVDGSTPDYLRWALTEPTLAESEDCVDLANGDLLNGWADRNCEIEQIFICEIENPS